MRLVDLLAQCERPFVIQSAVSGERVHLSGARELGAEVARCQLRYVLTDELTRLCTALAYSKGARALACADLLHVPAESVWVEWCEAPWQRELLQYGFPVPSGGVDLPGRRGALIRASRDGRRGVIRVAWAVGVEDRDPLVSPMEAFFDFDTEEGESPELPAGDGGWAAEEHRIVDYAPSEADVLARCFRLRLQTCWAQYYSRGPLTPEARSALTRHNASQLAPAIPVLLAFFLLLATRNSLPVREARLERLNRARARANKRPLLDHIEVSAPMFKSDEVPEQEHSGIARRRPRLHQVRGHLVRRGNQLFWRVPHLRGRAAFGSIRARTVTWTFNAGSDRSSRVSESIEPATS